MHRLVPTLAVGLSFVAFATASAGVAARTPHATPTDRASAHVAATAWLRYARDAAADFPAAREAVTGLFASVESGCPSALQDIGNSPPEQINWRAMQAVVTEWELDADLIASGTNRTRFGTFASKVAKLRWSSRATRDAVKRSIELNRRYLEATPADLCADIRAWAADPATTPVGALQFVSTSNRNVTSAGMPALVRAIIRFGKRADRRIILRISDIAFEYGLKETGAITTHEPDLFKALGLEKPLEMLEQDADAKSDARSMVSQVEACWTETEDYRACRTPSNTGLSFGSGPGQVEVSDAARDSYTVTAHSKSGTDYQIVKSETGVIARACTRSGIAGCAPDGTW